MKAFIYLITNMINLKRYVGKTIKPVNHRFAQHKGCANKMSKTHLHAGIRKHGIESFVIEVLEETTMEIYTDRETFYIEALKPEYNMTKGGVGSSLIEPMMRVTNGIDQRYIPIKDGIPKDFRRGLNNESIERARVSSTGRMASAETSAKMSASQTGKTKSSETKEKIRLKALGRKPSLETRALISANTGPGMKAAKQACKT